MKRTQPMLAALTVASLFACSPTEESPDSASATDSFEAEVADYIEKYSYQETFRLAMDYTKGDPTAFNVWVLGTTPALVKAGEDLVVRMNNDTYYKMAFTDLGSGPVVLRSTAGSNDRFSSFQLMDDRNVNFQNVIDPDGTYTLYYGAEPDELQGEAIESPSQIAVVIVRVEVRDAHDDADLAAAREIFNGITIDGPQLSETPQLDLLSGFSPEVEAAAQRLIDEAIEEYDFRELVAGPGQVPDQVSHLQLAAGSKSGWGGPVTSHSSYEIILLDEAGEPMRGENGAYSVTSQEPPVEAFWSITVYDTDRGGYLHPNDENKYHINNTTAIKNEDGTVTFLFKQACGADDANCLEVPAGRFDVTFRYYLPSEEVQSGEWTFAKLAVLP